MSNMGITVFFIVYEVFCFTTKGFLISKMLHFFIDLQIDVKYYVLFEILLL